MKKSHAVMSLAGLAAVAFMVAGCNVGPTYGTGKTAGQQLVDDVTSIVSLRATNTVVETRPRPELVRPSKEARTQLPPPQENVAQIGSADWPESPEERRQRLRDEATANQDNPRYVSPIESDVDVAKSERKRGRIRLEEDPMPIMTRGEMRAQGDAYKRRQQENRGGTATQRKYLSEPPVAYRQPAASAPVDEMGPDEVEKERKRKAASNKGKGSKWWPF